MKNRKNRELIWVELSISDYQKELECFLNKLTYLENITIENNVKTNISFDKIRKNVLKIREDLKNLQTDIIDFNT
jgi:hypothetical protein